MGQLAAQGKLAILLVEQYREFGCEVADDLLVMVRGQVVIASGKDDVDEAEVRRYVTV